MKRFEILYHSRRPLIMGIVNTTPDSFSDGGQFIDAASALRHGLEMVAQGADIIDVGGESTRPGAEPVSADQQIARVAPVVEALRRSVPAHILISIDTSKADVAAAALAAGADIINDVSAGRDDAGMFALAARHGVPIALMHMRGTPKTMQDKPYYQDVVAEVLEYLLARAEAAQEQGIARKNIILDPGIGFGKRKEDNLTLLANLSRFVATGYPVLLGTSRKRFMGAVCNETRPQQLLAATLATTAVGVLAGVSIFRVHDVRENRQAADVTFAIKGAGVGDARTD